MHPKIGRHSKTIPCTPDIHRYSLRIRHVWMFGTRYVKVEIRCTSSKENSESRWLMLCILKAMGNISMLLPRHGYQRRLTSYEHVPSMTTLYLPSDLME